MIRITQNPLWFGGSDLPAGLYSCTFKTLILYLILRPKNTQSLVYFHGYRLFLNADEVHQREERELSFSLLKTIL